jgi:hypothetical protein
MLVPRLKMIGAPECVDGECSGVVEKAELHRSNPYV